MCILTNCIIRQGENNSVILFYTLPYKNLLDWEVNNFLSCLINKNLIITENNFWYTVFTLRSLRVFHKLLRYVYLTKGNSGQLID